METFLGYRRSDGRVGVRNTIAVVPLSVAASAVATAIADGGPRLAAGDQIDNGGPPDQERADQRDEREDNHHERPEGGVWNPRREQAESGDQALDDRDQDVARQDGPHDIVEFTVEIILYVIGQRRPLAKPLYEHVTVFEQVVE